MRMTLEQKRDSASQHLVELLDTLQMECLQAMRPAEIEILMADIAFEKSQYLEAVRALDFRSKVVAALLREKAEE